MSRTRSSPVPELVAGDRLTRAEFERRYTAMPRLKKAELIKGVVYMPSPVRTPHHATPHATLAAWLGAYWPATPGVECGIGATLLLGDDTEAQPDLNLRIVPEAGGLSRTTAEGYLQGPVELVAEVTASTASYDLHDKKDEYRDNGVREYLVWRTEEDQVDWYALRKGRYTRLRLRDDGLIHSLVFPGLWLDPAALLARDTRQLLAALRRGLRSPEHAAFVAKLRAALGD